jgi:hypothetical protein
LIAFLNRQQMLAANVKRLAEVAEFEMQLLGLPPVVHY